MEPNIKLKILLFRKRMSQRALAFGTGIDESQISKLIRYGIGTSEIKDRLCSFLGVPREEIFREA